MVKNNHNIEIALADYLLICSSDNYIKLSSLIGNNEIMAKCVDLTPQIYKILFKINNYGSVVLDVDTELYNKNVNYFKSHLTALLELGSLILLTHSSNSYRNFRNYSSLKGLDVEVFYVNLSNNKKSTLKSTDGLLIGHNTLRLKVADRVSKITSDRTVTSILNDVSFCLSTEEITNCLIDLSNVNVVNMCKVYEKIYTYIKSNFKIKPLITSSTQREELQLAKMYCKQKYTSKDRLTTFLSKVIRKGTVILLYQYSLGRRDSYNRSGGGEIASVNIGVCRGFVGTSIVLDIYNEQGSKKYTETIPVDMLGFGDIFLGTKFHIELPIENSLLDIGEYYVDGQPCLISEYINSLLDKSKVSFNSEIINKFTDRAYDNLSRLI